MKKSKLFRTLGFIFLISILSNCNSDEPENVLPNEPEPPVNVEVVDWNKFPGIEGRIIRARNFGGNVHATGVSDVFFDIFRDDQPQPITIRPFLTRIGRYLPPLNENILVTRTENEIFIFNINNISEDKALIIKGVDLDENFNTFEDIPLWNGELLGLNDQNYILIPYRNVVNGIAQDNPSFALLEIASENGQTLLKNKTIIEERIFFSFNTCNRVQSFDDFFLVTIGSRVFKIGIDGGINEIFQTNNVVFKYGSELKTFELDRAANEMVLKRSNGGDGLNWSTVGRFPNSPALRTANFTTIFGEIIGFDGLDIFQAEIIGGNLNLNYLQSNNLEGGSVTSIIEFEDKVLITTNCNSPSTNCGVFLKSKEDFFLSRPQ